MSQSMIMKMIEVCGTVKFESLAMIRIYTLTQRLFQNRAILLSPYKAEVVPIEASKKLVKKWIFFDVYLTKDRI